MIYMKHRLKKLYAQYKKILKIHHGRVTFTLLYNPRPKSKGDYWRIDIVPFAGDIISLLLCKKDIGALMVLFGLAIKREK
jgi:hypothetical protein